MSVSAKLGVALAAIAVGAVAVPAWVVTHPPATPVARLAKVRRHVVPAAQLPPVEPVRFVDLSPEDARAYNASVPFSIAPNPAARPYRFDGTDAERARATDCLAAAVLYEAGDDAKGERAVAQVVLNRLRHPAFPKTVCAVVFEGAERSTGCQFTFTCDGALTRWTPSEAAWRRAREVAEMALAGTVYRPVGYATHYHTDWVVPYWQSSLDKVTRVGDHLFFRWTGWWGTPPAFSRRHTGDEPVEPQLAALSEAHRTDAATAEADAALGEAAKVLGGVPTATPSDPDSFLVTIPRGTGPDVLPALAAAACGERAYCRYSAWADPAKTPKTLPLSAAQVASMTFSYLRDGNRIAGKTLWNCQQLRRADPAQCMKVQVLTGAPAPIAVIPPPVVPTRSGEELQGVRRRMQPIAPVAPTVAVQPTTAPRP